jgi:hypothetical protein
LSINCLPPELAEVVGGLPGGVGGLSGQRVCLGGELRNGEAVGGGGQGEHCGQGGTQPWLVEIDAADADGSDLGWSWEVIQHPIGEEADVDAVRGGAEPFGEAGQRR